MNKCGNNMYMIQININMHKCGNNIHSPGVMDATTGFPRHLLVKINQFST